MLAMFETENIYAEVQKIPSGFISGVLIESLDM
jgi:hypothetical protein